jgi:hypothetical protein
MFTNNIKVIADVKSGHETYFNSPDMQSLPIVVVNAGQYLITDYFQSIEINNFVSVLELKNIQVCCRSDSLKGKVNWTSKMVQDILGIKLSDQCITFLHIVFIHF